MLLTFPAVSTRFAFSIQRQAAFSFHSKSWKVMWCNKLSTLSGVTFVWRSGLLKFWMFTCLLWCIRVCVRGLKKEKVVLYCLGSFHHRWCSGLQRGSVHFELPVSCEGKDVHDVIISLNRRYLEYAACDDQCVLVHHNLFFSQIFTCSQFYNNKHCNFHCDVFWNAAMKPSILWCNHSWKMHVKSWKVLNPLSCSLGRCCTYLSEHVFTAVQRIGMWSDGN